jgi:hypothetical protein
MKESTTENIKGGFYLFHNIGLLFSLFLLVVFGFLIFSNFTSISFNWQDLLIFAIVGLIVYLIVRAVGGSLDKKFNISVQEFIIGKRQILFIDKGILRTFGLLLLTLLPFLLYLFAIALFAAIDFAFYGLWIVSNLPRIPVAILLGLAIVAIGTSIAILIGFYYLFFPPKRKTFGINVANNEQKKL